MVRSIAKLAACLALLACALPGEAQRTQAAGTLSDSDCAFTFSSGSGNTFLQFCVAETGKITGTDGSIVLAHIDTIGPKQTKTTTMIYKRF